MTALNDLAEELLPRLTALGFRPGRSADWMMSSGLRQFEDGTVVFELRSDRGDIFIGMAAVGGHAFSYEAWSDAVGLSISDPGSVNQIDFFLDNLAEIRRAVIVDPDITARVQAANWKVVKAHLGLDPDMAPPSA